MYLGYRGNYRAGLLACILPEQILYRVILSETEGHIIPKRNQAQQIDIRFEKRKLGIGSQKSEQNLL